MEVVRRHFSLSDFQDEVDRRYPMLSRLGIDVHYGLEWEDKIEPYSSSSAACGLSEEGRMKAKLDRVRSNIGSIEESLLFPDLEAGSNRSDRLSRSGRLLGAA